MSWIKASGKVKDSTWAYGIVSSSKQAKFIFTETYPVEPGVTGKSITAVLIPDIKRLVLLTRTESKEQSVFVYTKIDAEPHVFSLGPGVTSDLYTYLHEAVEH